MESCFALHNTLTQLDGTVGQAKYQNLKTKQEVLLDDVAEGRRAQERLEEIKLEKELVEKEAQALKQRHSRAGGAPDADGGSSVLALVEDFSQGHREANTTTEYS